MSKRDLVFLTIAPVILIAVALELLWLAARLHDGAELRLADYAVLQERAAVLADANSASRSPAHAALTLSRLAGASHESDATAVTVSASLAALLLFVSTFQILTVTRLARNQQESAAHLLPEVATNAGAPLRPTSGVAAMGNSLSEAVNPTFR